MNYKTYTTKDLQLFQSMLNQFTADGVTDIRLAQQQSQNEIDRRFKSRQLKMSSEAKREARKNRQDKAVVTKEQIKSKPQITLESCPDCGQSHDLRMNGERQPDGSIWWYEGCPLCGYIQPIEDK